MSESKGPAQPASRSGTVPETMAPRFVLQLFVAGSTPRSLRAVENLRRMFEEHIPGQYELRVIDIYQLPEMAEVGQVIAAPTLVKQLPPPLRRVVGDMADEGRVLLALGVRSEP